MQDTRVGIDVGGTFTDGILVRNGTVTVAKVRSRPEDIAAGILDCCKHLGVDFTDVEMFIHGTTVATNAIIEKSGFPTAHVTTTGFRDVLFIRRGDSEPYNLQWQPPTPVVKRRNIFEVEERIAWDGSVLVPFNEEEAKRVAQIIAERGYKAVSVTFLHSYANPDHEMRMKEILQAASPDIDVCISYEVLPHYREFERSSTTAVNAYLMPLVRAYLSQLGLQAKERGFDHELLIMQSNGGVMTVSEAEKMPARTVRSGPAGGAKAASHLAGELTLDNAIFIDIGGTSTDVSVCIDGKTRWTPELEFSWGVPIRFPSVEIHSVGAGGGSIAWVDAGRFLKVGPQSAGASPGPACYDRGGEEPTTTDAQVVLGRLNPEVLLGGEMTIKRDLAMKAIEEKIAKPLDIDLIEAARGILRVTTNSTMQAIRLMTVNRGLDPRKSCLIAFGGSGALYAADVARLMAIPRVIIPQHSGVMSALGMVLADYQYDRSATLLMREGHFDTAAVEAVFAEFEEDLHKRLDDAGIPMDDRQVERFLDMRYDGQGYELPIPLPRGTYHEVTVPMPNSPVTEETFRDARAEFHNMHEREFGWQDENWSLEVVFVRAAATGLVRGKPTGAQAAGAPSEAAAPIGNRECYFLDSDTAVTTSIYERRQLGQGQSIKGPVIIEQMDTTTIVPPEFKVTVDDWRNLVLELA
jgi:N-methylhydantoinase A